MREESADSAALVVVNLPDLPVGETAFGWCELVEVLTENLSRTLLVRGTQAEVITAYT